MTRQSGSHVQPEAPSDDDSLPRGVDFRVRATWLSLFWERLWPAIVPAVGILLLFLAVALLDILPMLPHWLHVAALAAGALALLWVLWQSFQALIMPARREAERRLEVDNRLQHRPLTAVADHLPLGASGDAQSLWALHRRRALQALTGLRAHGPRFTPLALMPVLARVGLVMLLAVAAAAAGPDAAHRLARALQPGLDGGDSDMLALDVWITPPGYTNAAPIFLSGGRLAGDATATKAAPTTSASARTDPGETDGTAGRAPVRVPVGSMLLAQVQGAGGQPGLRIDDTVSPFEVVEEGVFKVSVPILEGERLAVTQGQDDLASWPIEVVPDEAPSIVFAASPTTTERYALRVLYEVKDDYGVNTARAVIRRSPDEGEFGADGTADSEEPADEVADASAPEEESIQIPLILPGPDTQEHTGAHYTDLTAHPWAGTPVIIQLEAVDAAEQVGRSDEIALILPERIFNHPVARAIAEQRKRLTTNPEERREVAEALHDLSARPDHYFDDKTVFLALQSAAKRLLYDDDPEAIAEVQQLLWDTALRVEDGEVSIASRDLREAQQALQDALSRNAPDAEIERLMDELAQAIDKFLDAMQQQMAQNQGEMQPMDPETLENMQMVDRQDLMEMLERAREMARTGAREAAQEMLSQLQNMLENLQNMPMQAMQDQRTSEAMEMMRNLQGLTQRQRELLDRTFREAQREGQQGQMGEQGQQGQPQQGQQPGQQQGQQGEGQGQAGRGNRPASAAEQEALRRMLGEMMRRLGEMTGEIPDSLGNAERSMRNAGRALGEAQPGQAVPHQSDAIDQLQQGMQSMAEQMMQALGAMPGAPQQSNQQQQPGDGRDPLGRSTEEGGYGTGNDVEIPSDAEMQRARDILRELHRRAGQPNRPPVERNYIDRLLERF